ncbi:hypothetical protein EVAR_94614_1 [Eumeta japonica]|uniref:Uncharacterized protein n=1 Tax=Eumeta variegata TaxID=151549 RepID=A0A4C1UVG0_EUMVA|nr:hypothetical protein EVAR_94614_1 [Eumeta japonica]
MHTLRLSKAFLDNSLRDGNASKTIFLVAVSYRQISTSSHRRGATTSCKTLEQPFWRFYANTPEGHYDQARVNHSNSRRLCDELPSSGGSPQHA